MFRTLISIAFATLAPLSTQASALSDDDLAACAMDGRVSSADLRMIEGARAARATYRTRYARMHQECLALTQSSPERARPLPPATARERRILAGARTAFPEFRTSRERLAQLERAARQQGRVD